MSSEKISKLSTIHWLLMLLVAALLAMPVAGGELLVGPQGAVLELSSGTYQELFPTGSATSDQNSVLALRVSGKTERLLPVPGTLSPAAEYSASLVYEREADLAYLLWEGLRNGIHPHLYLITFDGEAWGPLIEIAASPFARKGAPAMTVSSESVDSVERLVLNLVWWEETGGQVVKRYAAVVVHDGQLVDYRVYGDLSELLPTAEPVAYWQPNFDRLVAFGVQNHGDGAMIGFVDGESGRLGVVQTRLLPLALSTLAEQVRDLIFDLPSDISLEQILELAQQAVSDFGDDFHDGSIEYLAEQVAAMIVAEGLDGGLQHLGEKLGAHIIDLGHKVGSGGVRDDDPSVVLELAAEAGIGHHVKLSLRSTHLLPEFDDVTPELLISESGRHVTLAWPQDNAIYYLESDVENGWTEASKIRLDQHVDYSDAMALLAQRTAQR